MEWAKDAKVYVTKPGVKAVAKVDYPTLAHFISDVVDTRLQTVRLDAFQVVRESELSFIHYVTLTLFVTAHHAAEHTVYEYIEEIGTQASADGTFSDPSLLELSNHRLEQVANTLRDAGLRVRHGRYCVAEACGG